MLDFFDSTSSSPFSILLFSGVVNTIFNNNQYCYHMLGTEESEDRIICQEHEEDLNYSAKLLDDDRMLAIRVLSNSGKETLSVMPLKDDYSIPGK